MSLLSKGIGALTNVVKKNAPKLIKTVVGATPVGRVLGAAATAVAVGGSILSTIRNSGAKTSGATVPAVPSGPTVARDIQPFFEGSPVSTLGHSDLDAQIQAMQYRRDYTGPWTAADDRELAALADLRARGGGAAVSSNALMVNTAGAVPSWGNLATRAAPIVGRIAGRAAGAAGVVATGMAIYDAAGNLIGHRKRTRRMNVLNPKALTRANRRVQGFRDVSVRMLKQYGYTVSATRKAKPAKKRRR